MGERTAIAWTDHTFNPWWGSEIWASRFFRDLWGPHATYREFGDKHWNDPIRWNRKAAAAGIREKVFCASMADVFDKRAPAGARDRLWALIRATPWLDWQIVTKRIGNVAGMLPGDWGDGYANVWLVPTIVNQEEADRDLPKLFKVPAKVYGVSYEPALGPVDWTPWLTKIKSLRHRQPRGLDWIIGGGESDQRGMRECRIEWLENTARQCAAHGVAYFNKQIGAMPTRGGKPYPLPPRSKGDNPAEWPQSIQVREFPS